MIHRAKYDGPITFECNVCHEELETETNDFKEAMSTLKENGWSARKIGENWFHVCSFECNKEITRENQPPIPSSVNMSKKDALAWLGLEEKATRDDAKTAWKRVIQMCHPDKGGTNALAQVINMAYEVLKR